MQATQRSEASDALGKYAQLSFEFTAATKMSGSIRAYQDRALILFSYTLNDAVTSQPPPFPNFTVKVEW
jgi:hypothetical protein